MHMASILFNDIPLHEPLLQASPSPVPRIRRWRIKSLIIILSYVATSLLFFHVTMYV